MTLTICAVAYLALIGISAFRLVRELRAGEVAAIHGVTVARQRRPLLFWAIITFWAIYLPASGIVMIWFAWIRPDQISN
jgi:hypothetical protein